MKKSNITGLIEEILKFRDYHNFRPESIGVF